MRDVFLRVTCFRVCTPLFNSCGRGTVGKKLKIEQGFCDSRMAIRLGARTTIGSAAQQSRSVTKFSIDLTAPA
jgi:hypothetical protein